MVKHNIPYNLSSKNPIQEYAEVRKSKIHGLGLFAKKFISKVRYGGIAANKMC